MPDASPAGGLPAAQSRWSVPWAFALKNCVFLENRAWTGGALAIYGSERLRFDRCRFEGNISGFGGGAAFVQEGEFYCQDCKFLKNSTGRVFDPQSGNTRYACGGALYLGVHANAELHGCDFLHNAADYVGGACYLFDTNYHGKTAAFESVIADGYFIGNHASGSGSGSGGGAIRLDGESRLNLTDVWFVRNSFGTAWELPGQSILDASQYSGFAENPLSGLVLNGRLEFCEKGRDPKTGVKSGQPAAPGVRNRPLPRLAAAAGLSPEISESDDDFNRQLAIAHRPVIRPHVVPIVSSPMNNPKSSGSSRTRENRHNCHSSYVSNQLGGLRISKALRRTDREVRGVGRQACQGGLEI